MSPSQSQRGSTRLEEARREAELRLQRLRAGVQREVGFAPARKGLWLLVAAGAVGLALAVGTAARHGRRKTSKRVPEPRKKPKGRKRQQKQKKLSRRPDA